MVLICEQLVMVPAHLRPLKSKPDYGEVKLPMVAAIGHHFSRNESYIFSTKSQFKSQITIIDVFVDVQVV